MRFENPEFQTSFWNEPSRKSSSHDYIQQMYKLITLHTPTILYIILIFCILVLQFFYFHSMY